VYYAAALDGAAQKEKAAAFVAWLGDGAQPIFKNYFYDAPTGAAVLHA
jgi:ABC-type Fe3+ transport system substrate-binding protein